MGTIESVLRLPYERYSEVDDLVTRVIASKEIGDRDKQNRRFCQRKRGAGAPRGETRAAGRSGNEERGSLDHRCGNEGRRDSGREIERERDSARQRG